MGSAARHDADTARLGGRCAARCLSGFIRLLCYADGSGGGWRPCDVVAPLLRSGRCRAPGLHPAPVTAALRRALAHFGRQIPGFVCDAATLIGVETRTASPVRVRRGDDLQAVGLPGLYPAGEGMGCGGGIVSAAVDGIRVAEALLVAAHARPGPPAAEDLGA